MAAHRGLPDPAAAEGSEVEKHDVFRHAFHELESRIKIFTSLRIEALDRLSLKRKIDEIGRARAGQAKDKDKVS